MKERLEALLRELFAPDLVGVLAPRLSELVDQYRDSIHPPEDEYDPQLPMDETDIFLRVHENQFFGDSRKPAELLHEFLSTQLEGLAKGVYLGPDGASLASIQELAREHRVMVDLVLGERLGQISAQIEEPDYSDPEVVTALLEVLLRQLAGGVSVVRFTVGAAESGVAGLSGVSGLGGVSGVSGVSEPRSAGVNAVAQLSRALMAELAPWSVLVTDAAPAAAGASFSADAHMRAQYELAPLVLDSILRGSSDPVRCWARALPELPPTTTFFNILPAELTANFLRSVTDPALPVQQRARVFLCAQAIMLSLAGVPGVDTACLIASEGDDEWPLEYSSLTEELETAGSLRNVIFEGYKLLLRARSLEPLFHPAVPQKVLDLHPSVFAVLRSSSLSTGEGMLCIHNLSLDPVELMFSPSELGLDIDVGMREIIGGDIVFPSDEPGGLVSLEVDSYELLWLRTPVHLDSDENRSFQLADDDFPPEAAELEDKDD